MLNKGEAAPAFSPSDQHGSALSLADLSGRYKVTPQDTPQNLLRALGLAG